MHFLRARDARQAAAASGFTLVELMVTIAVAAILVTLAAPSFTAISNSNRLTSAANELVATFQSARMEAVRLNARTEVCASADGVSCGGDDWSQWLIRVDTNNDGAVDETLRSGETRAPVQVLASNSIGGTPIEFRSDGRAYTAAGALMTGTIAVCIPTTRPEENVRFVSIASGSRFSTTPSDGGGNCAAPANAAAGANAVPMPGSGGPGGGNGGGNGNGNGGGNGNGNGGANGTPVASAMGRAPVPVAATMAVAAAAPAVADPRVDPATMVAPGPVMEETTGTATATTGTVTTTVAVAELPTTTKIPLGYVERSRDRVSAEGAV